MRALAELGHVVPGEVSVMGCNDEGRATGLRPDLTTVHYPLEEMGARAASLVTEACDETKPHRREVLPVRLVERDSVARL